MTDTTLNTAVSVPSAPSTYPRAAYAWYVVGVLSFIYVFSYLDRSILNLLVAPIRRDLNISDTQMSLLIGFTFALFYVTFGIPMGRIADSHSRRGLIAAGFSMWSVFTAGCAFAGSYSQLMIMRLGVGVGEATLGPAAYSLITDYFPPRRRGLAMGIYHVGIYVGIGTAFLIGALAVGFVSSQPAWDIPFFGTMRSWQVILLIIGLAGLVSVPLVATIQEPLRRGLAGGQGSTPLSEVWAYYKKNAKAYVCLHLGFGLLAFSGVAAAAWLPSFFIRHYHWTASQFAFPNGVILTVCGSLGVCSSGWFADSIASRGYRDAFFRVASCGAVLWLLLSTGVLLAPDGAFSLFLFTPAAFFYATQTCMGPAALMQITPAPMRGQAGAIYLLVLGLVGQGLGPTAVALCTDYIFHDDNLVGYSILIVAATSSAMAALLLWFGRKAFVKSQDRLNESAAANIA